jgi:hypothetical protein
MRWMFNLCVRERRTFPVMLHCLCLMSDCYMNVLNSNSNILAGTSGISHFITAFQGYTKYL